MTVSRRRAPAALVAVSLIAVSLVAAAIVFRAVVEPHPAAPLPGRLVPTLVALAALCAVGLLAPRAPLAAWLGAAAAAAIAAVEVMAVCRALLDDAAPTGTPARAIVVSAIAGLAAVVVALAYVTLPRRAVGSRRLRLVAWAFAGTTGLVCFVAVGVALASSGADDRLTSATGDVTPVRAMNRVLITASALAIVLGLMRDVGGAALRARERARSGPSPAPSLREALADELLPWRARDRQQVAEAERARLAAELHAVVLPDLRQAAAAAELGGAPVHVTAGLRRSLEGVERLMHERQSIVLEEFGLLAALEWLAERTEERTGLVVDLELEGARVAERDAVPPDVARAAFRVALLALDNVARHAEAGRAAVRLAIAAGRLHLVIDDDGARPWDPAGVPAGRGLADMRREAATIGASVEIASSPEGSSVALAWPAGSVAGHPASPAAESAARRDAVDRRG